MKFCSLVISLFCVCNAPDTRTRYLYKIKLSQESMLDVQVFVQVDLYIKFVERVSRL